MRTRIGQVLVVACILALLCAGLVPSTQAVAILVTVFALPLLAPVLGLLCVPSTRRRLPAVAAVRLLRGPPSA